MTDIRLKYEKDVKGMLQILKKKSGAKSWEDFFLTLAKESIDSFEKITSEKVFENLIKYHTDDFKSIIEKTLIELSESESKK